MNEFWKVSALVLITVILALSIGKTEKDMSLLLSMAACSIVAVAAFTYIEPVVSFLWELGESAVGQSELLGILLKAVGIALISEVVCLICSDTGNASLGKTFQMLASAVVIYISIPLFQSLLMMVREILGEL